MTTARERLDTGNAGSSSTSTPRSDAPARRRRRPGPRWLAEAFRQYPSARRWHSAQRRAFARGVRDGAQGERVRDPYGGRTTSRSRALPTWVEMSASYRVGHDIGRRFRCEQLPLL
jgi:hypothetical protein